MPRGMVHAGEFPRARPPHQLRQRDPVPLRPLPEPRLHHRRNPYAQFPALAIESRLRRSPPAAFRYLRADARLRPRRQPARVLASAGKWGFLADLRGVGLQAYGPRPGLRISLGERGPLVGERTIGTRARVRNFPLVRSNLKPLQGRTPTVTSGRRHRGSPVHSFGAPAFGAPRPDRASSVMRTPLRRGGLVLQRARQTPASRTVGW